MQTIKHTLFASALSLGFILPAHAHEIVITAGGISSTLNSEQNYVVGNDADAGVHSAGTHTVLGAEFALGYVWNVNKGFDLGLEFYYDWVDNLMVQGSTGVIDTVNVMYGVRAMPGFKITSNTKIYIDLGYNLTDQTLDISNAHNLSGFTGDKTMEFNNRGAFQYGGGVETMIYKNIAIRLAYTVQQNNEAKFENETGSQYYAATPTVYNFFFGMSYKFQF